MTHQWISSSFGRSSVAPAATRPSMVVSTNRTSQCAVLRRLRFWHRVEHPEHVGEAGGVLDPHERQTVAGPTRAPVRSAHHAAIAGGSTASTTNSNGERIGCGRMRRTRTPAPRRIVDDVLIDVAVLGALHGAACCEQRSRVAVDTRTSMWARLCRRSSRDLAEPDDSILLAASRADRG